MKKTALILFVIAIVFSNAAAQDIEKEYIFLIKKYNQIPIEETDRDKFSLMANEIDRFLSNYPEYYKNDELLFIQGLMFEKSRNLDNSILSFFKTVRLFPGTAKKEKAIENLRRIFSRNKETELYKEIILREVIKDIGDVQFKKRFYSYLKDFNGINYGGFSSFLIKDAYVYLSKFEVENKDEIYVFIGDWYFRKDDSERALFIYSMVEEVFENSLFVPYAMLSRGNLLENPLNLHQEALEVLREMILKFPEHPSIIQARLIRGDIYENKLKDYIQAIAEYKMIVAQFPEDKRCADALFQASKIYRKKLKDYLKAIEHLEKLYIDYPSDLQAHIAVHLVGEIFEKDLDDYQMAVVNYSKVIDLYPGSEYAFKDLEKAAELAEKKLKNNSQAIELYRKYIEKSSNDKQKEKFERKIRQLQGN
ncbi:tetratricopeptide repeat protein [candidate division KSB1 bacterium]